MLHFRSAVCSLVILGILAAPARADVIGSKKKGAVGPTSAPMKERLGAVGLPDARLSALTSDEIAYFADAPERVQMVGETENLWYETAIGGAFLVASAALVIGIVTHNKDS